MGFPPRLTSAFALLLFCGSVLQAQFISKSGESDAASGIIGRLDQSGGKLVSYSRDGKTLLTAGEREARVWDAITFKPIARPIEHGAVIESAEFSPDGLRILIAGGGGARVWDAATGEAVTRLLPHGGSPAISAGFNADGTLVITARVASAPDRAAIADADKTAKVWSVQTGEPILEIKSDDALGFAQFSPLGNRILTVTAGMNGISQLWDAHTGKAVGRKISDTCTGFQSAVFSGDGKKAAIICFHHVDIVSAENGELLTRIEGFQHEQLIKAVAFSPDGQKLATATYLDSVRLWDTKTGKRIEKPIGSPTDEADRVQFSPDGRSLFVVGAGVTGVWDSATGTQTREMLGESSAAFSPDGTRLATTMGNSQFSWTTIWKLR